MIHVTYIVGFERSGSTLLHDLLALKNDTIGIGESRHIYKRFLRKQNSYCGCGKQFAACDFWVQVVNKMRQKGINPNDVRLKDSSIHNIWKFGYYQAYFNELYQIVAELIQRENIVDSSKSAYQAILLSSIKNLQFRIYHTRKNPHDIYTSLLKRSSTESTYAGHNFYFKLAKHELTILALDILSVFLPITNVTFNDIILLSQKSHGNGINHSCGGSPSKNKLGGVPTVRVSGNNVAFPLLIRTLMLFSRIRYAQISRNKSPFLDMD